MAGTDETWIANDERLWREAERIAQQAGLDTNGVYRALRNLELTPEERLRKALARGRLRVFAR